MKQKIKFAIFFSFLLILLTFTGCEEADLPEGPTPPGRQGTFFGQAVAGLHAYPDWAAQPKNMFIYPEEVEMGDEARVKILNFDYIYRFGYFFNPKDMIWEMFELEDGMKLKDWYIGKSARADIKITRDTFEEGENYVVLYACDKISEDTFDCNENKWMLTFFRVIAEEPYENWIIEDDVGDFIFISSKKQKQVKGGEEIKKYTAEYMKDNDKAIVEVATVKTMSAVKSLLGPWSAFKQNYELYGYYYLSSYIDDHEHFVLWLSGNTTVKIVYEDEDFPTGLVDEYLDKWPSTEVNFTEGTIAQTLEICGDAVVGGNERCDPPGSDCIVENFATVEIEEGGYHLVNNHEIHIIEISGNLVILNVDGEVPQVVEENEIVQFDAGYIHVLRIIGNKVRLAFGYDLGKCTSGCRCIYTTTNGEEGICGDGTIQTPNLVGIMEECDPPTTATQPSPCTAKSGLASLCDADCKCPEPLLGFTFCGDGAVQPVNSLGGREQCDPPGPWLGGVCTITCQFIPVWLPPKGGKCGDRLIDPISEQCDPPGLGCIRFNGQVGKCDANCQCGILSPKPIDVIGLKNALCGLEAGDEAECWGFGGECDVDGISGICNAYCNCDTTGEIMSTEDALKDAYCGTLTPECWPMAEECTTDEGEGTCNSTCECELPFIETPINLCGNNVWDKEEGEECDPAYSLDCTAYLLNGLIPIEGRCDSACGCNPTRNCVCEESIDEQDMLDIIYYLPSCKVGDCPDGMRLETNEDITILIIEDEGKEIRYALRLGDGVLDVTGLGKCICELSPVVSVDYTGSEVTSAVIVNKFDLRNPKTQLITAIISCLAILGILTVNFVKKD